MVSVIYDLSFDSDVLVWQENNAGHSSKWTKPYKLLAVKNKIYILQLPRGPTNFRIIIVKLYLQESTNTNTSVLYDLDILESDFSQPDKKVTNINNRNIIDTIELSYWNPTHLYKLPIRF